MSEWIDARKEIPKDDHEVLIFHEEGFHDYYRSIAIYVREFTYLAKEFVDIDSCGDLDYDDAGVPWLPEGWYYHTGYADDQLKRASRVRYWTEFPELPTEVSGVRVCDRIPNPGGL